MRVKRESRCGLALSPSVKCSNNPEQFGEHLSFDARRAARRTFSACGEFSENGIGVGSGDTQA